MALIINPAINGFSFAGGGNWTNSDGLTIYYGTQEAWLDGGGEYGGNAASLGSVHDYIIDLAALVTANPTMLSRDHFPCNQVIDRVELFVETVAASSGSGTLNIGVWDLTAAATISDTAIVAAATTAILAAQSDIIVIGAPSGNTALGNTYAGTKVGLPVYSVTLPATATNLFHDLVLTAKAGTAVFQSGVVRVRIFSHRTNHADTTYSPGGQD